ncbi:hypothetical protein BH09MYX1_BH09MYX1_04190 [soil metagenome]
MRAPLIFGALAILAACGGAAADSGAPNEVTFHAEQELLPAFEYDTGLQPASGPVQLQLVVSSEGSFSVDAIGVGLDENGTHDLVGKGGSGKLDLGGGLKLDGHLKVDQSGLPKYDGDIPGLSDAAITFAGTSAFDPFLLADQAVVSAPVIGKLPSIPLPGGLPGTLDLTIEEGTTVDFAFAGTCAALDGDQATYHGALARKGTIRIKPVVTLKLPVVGNKSFALPIVTVALPTAPTDVDLGVHTVVFAPGSATGEHATIGTCGAITVDAGAGDAAPDSASDAGADAVADADDPDADAGNIYYPVTGSCSAGSFTGMLTFTPDPTGTNWIGASLKITGSGSKNNNGTIWVEISDFDGQSTKKTIVKVLDTTDDYVANGQPRTITSFTAQRRAPLTSNGHTYGYSYWGELIFDKFGSDPRCNTVRIQPN